MNRKIRALRAHLLKHWRIANQFADHATIGKVPCLVLAKDRVNGAYLSDALPGGPEDNNGCVVDFLADYGRDAVLAYFDTLILGGIEDHT